MSYIGNTVENQNYVPAIDYFNGDGSTVAFTLSRPVASVAAVQAVISNVPQNPGSAFTVSGSTITFTSAPPSGTANIYVYYTSPNTQVVQPGQGTVGATQVDGNYALWNKSGSDINYTAGNVGIGTSSPIYRLQARPSTNQNFVAGGPIQLGAGVSIASVNDANSQNYPLEIRSGTMSLVANNTDSSGGYIRFCSGGEAERMRIDSSGNVGIGTSSPSTFGGKLAVASASGQTSIMIQTSGIGTGQIGNNGSSANLKIYNCYADGLLANGKGIDIDTGGNVLIGTTVYSSNGLSLSGTQGNVFIVSSTSYTSGYNHQIYNNPNGNVGYVQTSGSTCSYINASDYRLKENVRPLSDGLAKVMQLKPVEYNWKVDGAEGQGFLAHELQAVIPQAATGTKDEVDDDGKPVYQGIDPRHVVAFLTAAIQELKAELDELKAKVK